MQLSALTMASPPSRPGRLAGWALTRWAIVVLALHLGLLLLLADTWDWRLPASPQVVRTDPMQTRWVQPTGLAVRGTAAAPAQLPPAKTRLAQVKSTTPAANHEVQRTVTDIDADVPSLTPAVPDSPVPPPPEAAHTTPETDPKTPAPSDIVADAATPAVSSTAPTALETATAPADHSAPTRPDASAELAASSSLPRVTLASVPPSVLLSYRLNGQEKNIPYSATGELRWQHNDTAYEMSLSVKAFLLGTRHWRSQGHITSAGLAPTKFSDSWRSERAAHFDRGENRIVFSSNAPIAPLQAGAQDQISLYPQLAAAMAGSASQFKPGSRVQIQTATVRDALTWLLTLEQVETLSIDGQTLQATKWICQPRNRFDAKVEFWVTAEHHWLPVRIRITQVNGNFIDLNLSGQAPLPPLPSTN